MSVAGGCQDWPDCLSCPFPRCREEVAPATFQAWVRRERAKRGERRPMGEKKVRVKVEEAGRGGKHLRGTGFRVGLPYERAVELLGQSFGVYRKKGKGEEEGEKAPEGRVELG